VAETGKTSLANTEHPEMVKNRKDEKQLDTEVVANMSRKNSEPRKRPWEGMRINGLQRCGTKRMKRRAD